MDLQTIGWILVAWTALGLIVAVLFGGLARNAQSTVNEDELENGAEIRKVVRYMRKSRAIRPRETVPAAAEEPAARRVAS